MQNNAYIMVSYDTNLYFILKLFILNKKVYIVSLHEDERGDSNEK